MANLVVPIVRVPDDINDLGAAGFVAGDLARWDGAAWEPIRDLIYEPLIANEELIFAAGDILMVGVPR